MLAVAEVVATPTLTLSPGAFDGVCRWLKEWATNFTLSISTSRSTPLPMHQVKLVHDPP